MRSPTQGRRQTRTTPAGHPSTINMSGAFRRPTILQLRYRIAPEFWRVLLWLLGRRGGNWPLWIDSPQRSSPPPLDGLTATFVNHSTFLLGLSGVGILTDPIWADRAGPFSWLGPSRVRSSRAGVSLTALPPIDLVLLSHNHYDHLNLATLRRLLVHDPVFVTGLGNGRWLMRRGFRRVIQLDWWQSYRHGALEVTMTPAQHFSRRGLFDADRTLWGGFVVRGPAGAVFFAACRTRATPCTTSLKYAPTGTARPSAAAHRCRRTARWLMQTPTT